MKVERVRQLLPSAVEVLVEGTLLRFFGRKKRGHSNQFAVQLQGRARNEGVGLSWEVEQRVVMGWLYRGVGPEHHKTRIEKHGQPYVNDSADKRVARKCRLMDDGDGDKTMSG